MKNNPIKIEDGKQYQWNQDWANRVAHSDINKVISELKDIEDAHGEITPSLIVQSSKNKKSALHGYFEWDDTKAAHSWRMRQATNLLGNIEVKVISDGQTKFVRVYETIRRPFAESESKFKRLDSLTSINIESIKRYLIGDLHRIKTRLQRIESGSDAIAHIDDAIKCLAKKESTETKETQPVELKVAG